MRGALGRLGVADEEQVVTGGGGPHRRLADRAEVGDRAHLEVVGGDDAAIADLAPQVVVDDQARERGRGARLGIEIRIERMRGHEAVDAGRHRRHERHEMHGVHVAPVGVDDGQAEVGVDRRMALPGKVLGAGGHAGRLQPLDAGGAEARDQLGVLAVGADADIGAIALREHVEDRAEAHVHAEAAQLAALDQPLPLREGDLARRARGEVVGEDRHAGAEHDDAAALVVGRDQEPPAERALELREHGGQSLGALEVAAIQDESARPGLLEEAEIGIGDVRPAHAEHELPADHLLEAHVALRGWEPAP